MCARRTGPVQDWVRTIDATIDAAERLTKNLPLPARTSTKSPSRTTSADDTFDGGGTDTELQAKSYSNSVTFSGLGGYGIPSGQNGPPFESRTERGGVVRASAPLGVGGAPWPPRA